MAGFGAGFGHGPAVPAAPDDPVLAARNARYGLVLFTIYLALYGGFVGLTTFAPAVLTTSLNGINLAIVYGFGLILAALVLALIYCWLCRSQTVVGQSPASTTPTGKDGE